MTSPATQPIPLPNIELAGQSFDILSFDLFNPGNANRAQIFNYQDTQLSSDKNYLFPSQLTFTPLASANFKAESQQMFSAYDLQQSFRASVSVSGDDPFEGMYFSASASYSQVQDTTQSFSSVMTQSIAVVESWKLSVISEASLPLTDDFQNSVNALPADYDLGTYLGFIENYGTHYASIIYFGGIAYQRTQMSASSASSLWQSNVDVSAQAGVLLAASVKAQANTSTKEYQEFYSKVESSEAQYAGGTTYTSFEVWAQTVPKNPVIVNVTITPLYELLTSTLFPQNENIQSIQENLANAYSYYMNHNGQDAAANAIAFKPWPVTIQPPPAVTIQPYDGSPDVSVSVNKNPNFLGLAGVNALDFALIDPGNQADGSSVQFNQDVSFQWVNISSLSEFNPALGFPSCMELDSNGNMVLSLSTNPPGAEETWQLINPFLSANQQTGSPNLVFPGMTCQIYNPATESYLKASGSSLTKTTEALDPATLWVLQTDRNYAPSVLKFDGQGSGYVSLPFLESVSNISSLNIQVCVYLDPLCGGNMKVVANTNSDNENIGFVLGIGEGDMSGQNTYRTLYPEVFINDVDYTFQMGNIPLGQWVVLALAWSGGTTGGELTGSINNQIVGTINTEAGYPETPDSHISVGIASNNLYPFNGLISTILIQAGNSGLQYWAGDWQFTEGSGNTINNILGSGNGTINGDGLTWTSLGGSDGD